MSKVSGEFYGDFQRNSIPNLREEGINEKISKEILRQIRKELLGAFPVQSKEF